MFNFRTAAALAVVISTGAATTAAADETLILNTLEIVGIEENTLTIVQSPDAGHVAKITFSGRANGGASAEYPSDPAWFGPLEAGTIRQTGHAQLAVLSVSGIGNLFAISQAGSNNSVSGSISGTGNMAVVQQSGYANRTQFSQQGQGNRLSVSQNM
ncbi:hypothetical protein ABMC89_11195 [Sulfitobacter sp. HNIBRBA3233]|uniref:hypothetical protein n=1 Tax=Sulfitobacter marinivivus TaxID=3158558 RepID=UPI0032DEBFF6